MLEHEPAILAVRGATAESMCRLQIGRPTTVHGSSMSCFLAYIWSVYEHHSRTKPCVHGARWSCQSVDRRRGETGASVRHCRCRFRPATRLRPWSCGPTARLSLGCHPATASTAAGPFRVRGVGLGWSKRDSEAPVPFQRTSPFEQCQSELKVPLTITHNTSLECFALCSPLNPACFRS